MADFERRHFEALAGWAADQRTFYPDPAPFDSIIGDLADFLASTNPRFNAGRFLLAAHVGVRHATI